MATINKASATVNAPSFGLDRIYWEEAIVGQGAAAPIIQAPVLQSGSPPGSALISGITRTSTGVYVVTLYQSFFARIYSSFDIDDSAGIGSYGTLGNWTNLNTNLPVTVTLRTWNASGSTPTDIPLNTTGMFAAAFKGSYTGSVA